MAYRSSVYSRFVFERDIESRIAADKPSVRQDVVFALQAGKIHGMRANDIASGCCTAAPIR